MIIPTKRSTTGAKRKHGDDQTAEEDVLGENEAGTPKVEPGYPGRNKEESFVLSLRVLAGNVDLYEDNEISLGLLTLPTTADDMSNSHLFFEYRCGPDQKRTRTSINGKVHEYNKTSRTVNGKVKESFVREFQAAAYCSKLQDQLAQDIDKTNDELKAGIVKVAHAERMKTRYEAARNAPAALRSPFIHCPHESPCYKCNAGLPMHIQIPKTSPESRAVSRFHISEANRLAQESGVFRDLGRDPNSALLRLVATIVEKQRGKEERRRFRAAESKFQDASDMIIYEVSADCQDLVRAAEQGKTILEAKLVDEEQATTSLKKELLDEEQATTSLKKELASIEKEKGLLVARLKLSQQKIAEAEQATERAQHRLENKGDEIDGLNDCIDDLEAKAELHSLILQIQSADSLNGNVVDHIAHAVERVSGLIDRNPAPNAWWEHLNLAAHLLREVRDGQHKHTTNIFDSVKTRISPMLLQKIESYQSPPRARTRHSRSTATLQDPLRLLEELQTLLHYRALDKGIQVTMLVPSTP
jgi:hypothetical protein